MTARSLAAPIHFPRALLAALGFSCVFIAGGCSRHTNSAQSSTSAISLSAIGDQDAQPATPNEMEEPLSARGVTPNYDVSITNTGGPLGFRLGAGDSLGQSVFSHYIMLVRSNADAQYASGENTND